MSLFFSYQMSILKQTKELVAFFFVFIFLYAGVIRGIITSEVACCMPNNAQKHSETKATIYAQTNYFNTLSIANQYKEKGESESDEVHFDFEISFSSYSPFLFLSFARFFSTAEISRVIYFKLPLYDLFCNWKLHFR